VTGQNTDWLDDREQKVWRRLLAVESRMHDQLDKELLEAHGLSIGDYAVLVHLSEASGFELRMSELADRLLLSRSGLTRRVDGLVKSELVSRQACRSDRRGALAQLTPAGLQRLREAAPTHVAGVRRYLIDALGDLDGLSAGLERIERVLPGPGPASF
jgi:DNA-binding MarR family transcriptional regulator